MFSGKVRILAVMVLLAAVLVPGQSRARPQFAQLTGQPCGNCHVSPLGGGELKPAGEEFQRNLKDLSVPMDPNLRVSTGQRLLHLALYFLHIPFGVAWLGLFAMTFSPILRRKAPGVVPPKQVVRQILTCMAVILLTGPFMVAFRMKTVPGLFTTRFGVLLLLKIAAVLTLLAATAFVLWHTHVLPARRYRRLIKTLDAGGDLELTPLDLALFNGTDKRRALVAVEGRIFDVTGRNLWRKGIHPGGHHAGHDLTNAFGGAPHGPEVLERVPPVGRVQELETGDGREPLFLAVSLGTAASVVILMVVALWRW